MKHTRILIVTTLLMGLLVGCGARSESDSKSFSADAPMSSPTSASAGYANESAATEEMGGDRNEMAQMDSIGNIDDVSSIMSSSAAKGGPLNDTVNKFIRTADVRFRVQNVRNATFAIEKITAHYDGYVAHTGLESTINNELRTKVSDDSTLITTYYTVSNNMVLRVPVEHLDSTLRTMGALVKYLDYRRIHAENATLMILRERLAARRINRSTARLEDAVDETNAKLRDRATIEEALYNKQTMADESLIRTLELKDQINLSTITLQIYQRQEWTREMVANEKDISAYKPGFLHEIGQSLHTGWEVLKGLILIIVTAWPLVLIVLGVFGIVVLVGRRSRK